MKFKPTHTLLPLAWIYRRWPVFHCPIHHFNHFPQGTPA